MGLSVVKQSCSRSYQQKLLAAGKIAMSNKQLAKHQLKPQGPSADGAPQDDNGVCPAGELNLY
jgi:hypothetical protein